MYCKRARSAAVAAFALFSSLVAGVALAAGKSYDFNADSHPDLIWSNASNGSTYLWNMGGAKPAMLNDAFITQVDPSWKVQGVADFDGDGKPDIVWRNTANGNTYLWHMNGATFKSDAFLFNLAPVWTIQGVADFNADGKPDFLIRNTSTGVGFVWFFKDTVASGDKFLFQIDPIWRVEAVTDMTGDGQPDLIFRHATSGLAFVWKTQYTASTLSLGTSNAAIFAIDPKWEIAQVADWNGDGKMDFVFRNGTSGVVLVWYSDGTRLTTSDYLTQIDPVWEIAPRQPAKPSCAPSNVQATFTANGQWKLFDIPRGSTVALALPVAHAGGQYAEMTTTQTTWTQPDLTVELAISACPGDTNVPAACKSFGGVWGGVTQIFGNASATALAAGCQLVPGTQYYVNVKDRKQDGTPSCTSSQCTMILQYNGNLL